MCPICNKPIKNYRKAQTCSSPCSYKYSRSGKNHWNWGTDNYRRICFLFHKKECIICKEDKIVEVHHYDRVKKNNNPDNLIPLCPTHHKYMHSRYEPLIAKEVSIFHENLLKKS